MSRDHDPPLRRASVTLTLVVFVTILANSSRLAKFPLRALLKDDIGLTPEQMATFFAVAGLAWYIKPLAALLSDHVPLLGTRRRHYIMLSGAGGALVWLVAALSPRDATVLLAAMVTLNCFAVLGNTVAGGLLVDAGRKHHATGALSAARVLAMNTATLIGGPLSGWLAGRAFGWTCWIGVALTTLMLFTVSRLPEFEEESRAPVGDAAEDVRKLLPHLRARQFWSVCLLTAAFYVAPGIQSLFYYFQRDVLVFTDQQIGLLAALNCGGGILAAVCYGRFSARFRLGALVPAGIVFSGAFMLMYRAYNSLPAALVIEPIAGFCFVLGVLPLHELTARASPPKHEALGFAVILSLGNAAIAFSDVSGAYLAKTLGLDLSAMLAVNALFTIASAALVALVPAALLGRVAARPH